MTQQFKVHCDLKDGGHVIRSVKAITPSQASSVAKMELAQLGQHVTKVTKIKVDRS